MQNVRIFGVKHIKESFAFLGAVFHSKTMNQKKQDKLERLTFEFYCVLSPDTISQKKLARKKAMV